MKKNQTKIANFLLLTGLSWAHVVLITVVLVVFAVYLLIAAFLNIKENLLLSISLFSLFLIHILLIKFLGFSKNLKVIIKKQEAGISNDKPPGNFQIATACFAIFSISYLLFHAFLDALGINVEETSYMYSISMFTGFIVVCVIFWPVCKRKLK